MRSITRWMIAPVLATMLVAACSPKIPDSGAGVGFNSYPQTSPYGMPPGAMAPAPANGFSTGAAAAAIDRAAGTGGAPLGAAAYPPAGQAPGQGALIGGTAAVQPATAGATGAYAAAPGVAWNDCSTPQGIAMTTTEMTGGQAAGISDENDFGAVSGRRSIEGDKRQIECNRAQYSVDQPGALPTRKGTAGPNLAQYAVSTTNMPGVPIYRRTSLGFGDPAAKCARYTSPDMAQQDFLAAGGPERDRKGLDPDGDGFACDWDPRPFRAALQ